jgi:hypothetical protein
MAQGAAFLLRVQLEPASQWIQSHGHDILRLADFSNLMESYTAKIGIEGSMDQIRTAPEEDEDTLRKELAVGEVDALEAAIASVQAGNNDDVSRVKIHASTLRQFTVEHGITIRSSAIIKRIQKLNTAIHELAAKDSSLSNAAADVQALLLHR